MNSRYSLEIAGGVVLIVLGILFIIAFGFDLLDLTTDTIFIVFGVLLVRGAHRKNKASSDRLPSQRENRATRRAKKKEKAANSN